MCLVACAPLVLAAQRAEIRDKNVVFVDAAGVPHRLTQSGRDADASLSPDQKTIVFARQVWGETSDTRVPVVTESEIWIVPADGKTEAHKLLSLPPVYNSLRVLDSPAFSPDGNSVYFMSDYAATCGALWKLGPSTGHARMIVPGAIGFIVIQKGSRRGWLVVQRRGECAWDDDTGRIACYPFFLVTAYGKVVRRIAEDNARIEAVASRHN